ncbi:hypothetical protein G6514_007278 [Epicoccum nigrum]|nr:hypothetical protein G6514_007278 [Epicoccum nigrum]
MSAHIPLRIARSPAHPLRRQCLFQRPIAPSTPRCITATAARAFSSTPARLRNKQERLVDTRLQMAAVEKSMAGRESPDVRDRGTTDPAEAMGLTQDIGILQGTVIRAPFSKLPMPTSWEFYSYFWTVIKSKFTALYTRCHYKRCVHKTGIASYLPVDFLKQQELKNKAKKMYKQYYESLTAGKTKVLKDICLDALLSSSRRQIRAQSAEKMSWQLLKFKSARIVSHRCAPLGSESPDTSYRQCIVRLESEQQLSVGSTSSSSAAQRRARAPAWMPKSAKAELNAVSAKSSAEGKQTIRDTVVEYIVMQTRVVRGKPEEWKLWGFTKATTPDVLEEDDEYWRKTMEAQSARAS